MTPRGLKNCNPGNIRLSNEKYVGEIKGEDTAFKTFKNMAYGYRALLRDIRTKINRGVNTVEKIITIYAPPSENQTQAYINAVAQKVGVRPNESILPSEYNLIKIACAISTIENGIKADIMQVKEGYKIIDSKE